MAVEPSNGAPSPETVYVNAAPPGAEATSNAPLPTTLTPAPDASSSGGGPVLSPTPGTPGSIAPDNPQPARPSKETFAQGLRRGAHGEVYAVDGNGTIVNARTTAPSGKGEFGSVLGGIVMGALAGLTASRPGRIPSAELGGGAGAGAAAAVQAGQQRDARNRGVAQQNFANQQQVQKANREQLESQAQIAHLSADSERIRQATKFADEEQPLIMAAKKMGLTEQAENIQKMSVDIQKSAFEMMETFAKYDIDPSGMLTSFQDAHPHAGDIGTGRSAALYNGVPYGEEGHGSGVFDPRQVRTTALLKPEKFSTWTAGKNGEAVEQVNTLPAGTTALDYASAKMRGMIQLERIQSQQKIKLGLEVQKADVREKNAQAFKAGAEGKKAEAETVNLKEGIQGQAEDLVNGDMDPSQIQKRGNQYTPILNAAREYSMKKNGTPFDLAKAQEDYKFASDPRTQNRLKYMNSLTGDERTGTAGNLDLLIQYSDKVNRTDFPALNNVAAWAKLESGNTDIIKFHNAAIDAADQFANIMNGGGSGSATSDAKIKQGMDMFSQKFSKDQIKASASSVKEMLTNRKREFIGDNRYLRKQYLPAETQQGQPSQQQRPSAPQSNLQNPFRVSQ